MLIRRFLVFLLLCFNFVSACQAVSLNGTTGTSIYQSALYAFANGDFAKGFVCLNSGFSVPVGGTVTMNMLNPISGTINLNGTGGISLDGDITLGSNITIQNGGFIDGQDNTIFLNGDLTIPAGTGFEITSNTVIDGQGHDIVFQDGSAGAYFWINGPVGTTLTLRNCAIKGLKNYSGGYGSFVFGTSDDQKLVLNGVNLYMAGNYNFSGGYLDVKNKVSLFGINYYFAYNSEYALTIKPDSTLFIDMRTVFTYDPEIKQKHPTNGMVARLVVMEDRSSQLYLNGCTIYLPLTEGLVLTKGHLIVDHKTIVYGNGVVCGNYSYGMAFGDGKAANDLMVDIMPGADLQVYEGTLHYGNSN